MKRKKILLLVRNEHYIQVLIYLSIIDRLLAGLFLWSHASKGLFSTIFNIFFKLCFSRSGLLGSPPTILGVLHKRGIRLNAQWLCRGLISVSSLSPVYFEIWTLTLVTQGVVWLKWHIQAEIHGTHNFIFRLHQCQLRTRTPPRGFRFPFAEVSVRETLIL